MKCPDPNCHAPALVKETAQRPDGTTRRRYECFNGHRFTTLEEFMDGSLTKGPMPHGRKTYAIEPTFDQHSRARKQRL